MNRKVNRVYCYAVLYVLLSMLSACIDEGGTEERLLSPIYRQELAKLSEDEIDFIENFNVIAKSVRDFPPEGKNIEKYFYIFKSVADIRTAKYLLFGEQHTNSAGQLWTAGTINELIERDDALLFEGNDAGIAVLELEEYILKNILAARLYELKKLPKKHKPDSILAIKNAFSTPFAKTKKFLALNMLRFSEVNAFFWDLRQGKKLHPDSAKRNETMVQCMKDFSSKGKIIVIAGALHIPHYEFAAAIKSITGTSLMADYLHSGAKTDILDDAHYRYFTRINSEYGKTKSIFQFLKGKDFAIFIPKNLPRAEFLEAYFPSNAQ